MNLLYFFAVRDSKMATVTKNSAEHENDNISITAKWISTKFVSERFFHEVDSKLNKNRPVKFASISKKSKVW